MKKIELNAFRKTLEKRQIELGNGYRKREALAIETSSDEGDRMRNASDLDDAMRNLERNSDRLHEVESALRRMDEGTFGVCIGCEEDITPKRLVAVPWASSCIVCQEAADHTEKTTAREFGPSFEMAA